MNEKSIGCYIVEPVVKPSYLTLECNKILTISSCICDMEPDLTGCFWQGHLKEKEEYRKKLNLTQKEFRLLQEYVENLFETHLLDTDGRFVAYSAAVEFYRKFLPESSDAKLLQVFLPEQDVHTLETLGLGQNVLYPEADIVQGTFLGRDIIGYDCGWFHSYLCNGLEKDICLRHMIKINEFGLLQNDYNEVLQFVDELQGKGEPVEWMPCTLYCCHVQ